MTNKYKSLFLHFFLFSLLSLLTFLLSACNSDDMQNEVKENVNKIKTTVQQVKVKPKEVVVQPVAVKYNPVQTADEEKLQGPESENPLQKYPLKKYQYSGSILENGMLYAYIIDPSGHSSQIKVGDTLGRERGRVESIDVESIKIKTGDTEFEIKKG